MGGVQLWPCPPPSTPLSPTVQPTPAASPLALHGRIPSGWGPSLHSLQPQWSPPLPPGATSTLGSFAPWPNQLQIVRGPFPLPLTRSHLTPLPEVLPTSLSPPAPHQDHQEPFAHLRLKEFKGISLPGGARTAGTAPLLQRLQAPAPWPPMLLINSPTCHQLFSPLPGPDRVGGVFT